MEQIILLMVDPDMRDVLSRAMESYAYWDKIKYYKSKYPPQDVWLAVKLSRRLNANLVFFGGTKFSYKITDHILRNLHNFDLNIGGNLAANGLIPPQEKQQFLISSIMEEAIASSQIEGAVTTRKQAKEMLRKNVRPKNKSEQMIFNNYETIKHIVNNKNAVLNEETLFQIHRLISYNTLDDTSDEGRYRDNNEINVVDVTDGEIMYTPPEFDKIPGLMNELFLLFNSDNEKENFIHPIIKACIIHFMVGYIHPFVDGNGRTARALFYWFLLKNGYWLTEYLSISRMIVKSKTAYALAYLHTEIDENDLTYFINYKINTMRLAFEELRRYIQRKIQDKKRAISYNKVSGISERQALILSWLDDEPQQLITVKEVENRLLVSNQTARTDLQGLSKMGLLSATDLNKKTQGFYRSTNFESILKQLQNKFSF